MSLSIVPAEEESTYSEFIHKAILWYINRRRDNRAVHGKVHLGVTRSELERPFLRFFSLRSKDFEKTINEMAQKGTLLITLRFNKRIGNGSYARTSTKVEILDKLPTAKQANGSVQRFYLPDHLPLQVRAAGMQMVEIDQLIRDITRPLTAVA